MVSVIIATRDRQSSLRKCLASLKKQSFKNFEIIIEKGGQSLSHARELGFQKAKGEIIAYIDDDVEVTKNWLEEIVKTFKDKAIGGVSGPIIISKSKLPNRDVFKFYSRYSYYSHYILPLYNKLLLDGKEKEVGRIVKCGLWTPGANFIYSRYSGYSHYNPYIPVDYLEACNMSLRKDLVAQVGGFDLGFKGTSEWCEVDLAIRVKNLGFKLIFNPRAAVHHHLSREGVFSTRANSKERMENFLRYWFKNHKYFNGKTIDLIKALIFWDIYWLYKAITTKNIKWLGGFLIKPPRNLPPLKNKQPDA